MPKPSEIAHLPRALREERNSRLDDGESGKSLLPWLNSLPEAQTVIAKEFPYPPGPPRTYEPDDPAILI